MDRRVGRAASSLQRDVEETRIRFFHALVAGVEERIDVLDQSDALEQVAQSAVGVRNDHEPVPARAQRGERRTHLVRDRLPQIRGLVIDVEIGERVRRGGRKRDARFGQDEIEVRPAALVIVGRLDDLAVVEALFRARVQPAICEFLDRESVLCAERATKKEVFAGQAGRPVLLLGAVGQQIGNQASFDPRNYGYRKLIDLIEATQLFELDRRGSQVVLRDKRQARTARA